MSLSHLEFVKLQHLLAYIYEPYSDAPLSEFNPLSYAESDGDTCLHIAARRSDMESIRLLIKGGVDINAKGDNGYTPLDCALSQNNGDVVSYLIEHQAVPRMGSGAVRKWIKDTVR